MAKASHGTSHAVAVLGWLINHVRLKPSEWLAPRCAAPEPCSPVQRKGMDTATVERKLFLMLNKHMWEATPGVHLPC